MTPAFEEGWERSERRFDVVVWGDPVCPWCYVGQRRTALLESLGGRVTMLPYELHPTTPIGGRDVTLPPGSRIEAVYTRLAAASAAEGLPFSLPKRLPNTSRALATVEVVRELAPLAVPPLWAALYRTHFADDGDVGDPAVLDRLVAEVGLDAAAVREAVEDGQGRMAAAEGKERALEEGVTGVPAWHIDGRLLVPGLQEPAWFERVIGRLLERRPTS